METIQKLNQKELKNKLTAALGAENAKKFLAIAPAILESELDKTIAEFPRLHKSQVIRLFENVANVKKSDSISGGKIFRPTLISLIESLEAYTGRRMLKENSLAPLRYLEDTNEKSIAKPFKVRDITIEDIADFFSERINRRIERLIAKSNMPQSKEREIDRTPEGINIYLKGCCKNTFDKETKVCELIPQALPSGEDNFYIVAYMLEQHYNKRIPNSFDFREKTVADLIKFFAAV